MPLASLRSLWERLRPANSEPWRAPYAQGKAAALSFTFDDGGQNQLLLGAPVLEQAGYRGTYFVIAGLTRERASDTLLPGSSREFAGVSWEEWRIAAIRGHEIGNHSMSHPALHQVSRNRLRHEILDSKKLLCAKLGRPCLTFAYPYHKMNSAVRRLALKHHLAARKSGIALGGPAFTVAAACARLDAAIAQGEWISVVIHGIEEGYHAISRETFAAFVNQVKVREEKLWVATYGEVAACQRRPEGVRWWFVGA